MQYFYLISDYKKGRFQMDKVFFKNYYKTFKSNIIKITGETKQNKIASVLGVSEATISRWFSGTAIPTLADLLEISKKFDCSIDWLLGNDLKSETNYSAHDFCKVLVNIDKSIPFKIEFIEENFPYEPAGFIPTIRFLYTSSFTNPEADKINRFLNAYNGLKEARSQGLIDNDLFKDAVHLQLAKTNPQEYGSFMSLPEALDEEPPF